MTSLDQICFQQEASEVLLEFRKTLSAKQSKTAFLPDKMESFTNGVGWANLS
jgi:hypothetical protein